MEKIDFNTKRGKIRKFEILNGLRIQNSGNNILYCKLCGKYITELTDKCIRGKCMDITNR